jgi:hypothetical protein
LIKSFKPAVQEIESVARISSRVDAIVELVFDQRVSVSVGRVIRTQLCDYRRWATMEIKDQEPSLWKQLGECAKRKEKGSREGRDIRG